jgi:hypothetical protein
MKEILMSELTNEEKNAVLGPVEDGVLPEDEELDVDSLLDSVASDPEEHDKEVTQLLDDLDTSESLEELSQRLIEESSDEESKYIESEWREEGLKRGKVKIRKARDKLRKSIKNYQERRKNMTLDEKVRDMPYASKIHGSWWNKVRCNPQRDESLTFPEIDNADWVDGYDCGYYDWYNDLHKDKNLIGYIHYNEYDPRDGIRRMAHHIELLKYILEENNIEYPKVYRDLLEKDVL